MFPDFYVGQPLNVTKVVDLIEFVIDFTNWFYFIPFQSGRQGQGD